MRTRVETIKAVTIRAVTIRAGTGKRMAAVAGVADAAAVTGRTGAAVAAAAISNAMTPSQWSPRTMCSFRLAASSTSSTTTHLSGPTATSQGQTTPTSRCRWSKSSACVEGDLVTGVIRTPREGERKEKFNPMVRIDTVNGGDLESARQRPDFAKLTPLYPQERLKLETTPTQMAGRIIDLVAPIGKGQRALIVSPSKAGKTLIMQAIANSIAMNNPEVKLMVVLVDERPKEVTDFERSAKGEVISSTFDRPAEDHTTVAELAIERAKRLVELGHDVVILLDGITRLSRAYNLAAPASRTDLVGWCRFRSVVPAEEVPGCSPQYRGWRLTHDHRDCSGRDRLEDG